MYVVCKYIHFFHN